MKAADSGGRNDKSARDPEWLYRLSDEQFVQWCMQHKLQVCSEVRSFTEEERIAIFQYAMRQHLVN
jgi:hypothetical protein